MANSATIHESTRQRADVSDRGMAFGDVYLNTKDGETEVRFCWTGDGKVWAHGNTRPTTAQKMRAVRALAETPAGRHALGLGDDYDPSSDPSADEEELEELRKAATEAGLIK